jgi:hypothetical protein
MHTGKRFMKEWFKRVFNRNVYLTFDIPTSSGDVRYRLGLPTTYTKGIIELCYTGIICHSNDEAVLNLFMLSKHDGKRGWRFPTMHEAILFSAIGS